MTAVDKTTNDAKSIISSPGSGKGLQGARQAAGKTQDSPKGETSAKRKTGRSELPANCY
jgi:hypothetical protein